MKNVVRKTFTSESTGFKIQFANHIPGSSEVELNVFDLVDLSIRKGPNSIVFGNLDYLKLDYLKPDFFALNFKGICFLRSYQ